MSKANTYTIGELSSLTGYKTSTLRIWEDRYQLLKPIRTEFNQRRYTSDDLAYLFKVKILQQFNYRISKIASYDSNEIHQILELIASRQYDTNTSILDMTAATLQFNREQLQKSYLKLASHLDFKTICIEHFIPLITKFDLLTEARSTNSTNLSFLEKFILQKIHFQTEILNTYTPSNTDIHITILESKYSALHRVTSAFLYYEIQKRTIPSLFIDQPLHWHEIPSYRQKKNIIITCANPPYSQHIQSLINIARESPKTHQLILINDSNTKKEILNTENIRCINWENISHLLKTSSTTEFLKL